MRLIFKGLISRWTFVLGDFFSNMIKERSAIKLDRAQILCIMHPWERKVVPLTACFIRNFVCFMASRHVICLCSSHSTFTLWCHLKLSLSFHSYMKNRENNRPQPSDLPNWMASHFPFIPLYVNQGSLLPGDIKTICFVWWNVRSTGEGEQKSLSSQRKRGITAAAAQRKIKPGAEKERMWRDEGVRK